MWLYAFSSVDRILTRVLFFLDMRFMSPHCGFHTLTQSLLTYLKILINSFYLSLHMNLPNSFLRSMKAKLSHRIRKLLHVRTSKMNPALRASPLMHEELFFPRKVPPPHPRACGNACNTDTQTTLPCCRPVDKRITATRLTTSPRAQPQQPKRSIQNVLDISIDVGVCSPCIFLVV